MQHRFFLRREPGAVLVFVCLELLLFGFQLLLCGFQLLLFGSELALQICQFRSQRSDLNRQAGTKNE